MRRPDIYVVGPYSVALVASCILYYCSLQIAPPAEGQLGADVWPKTILILAIITCIWEIGRNLVGARASVTESAADEAASMPHDDGAPHNAHELTPMTPWIGIALTAVYVFAFPWIGYPLATFVYVAAFVYLGNFRRPLIAVCVGIAASLGFMFLFMRVVYVSLPIGVEPFAQVSTVLMHAMGIK